MRTATEPTAAEFIFVEYFTKNTMSTADYSLNDNISELILQADIGLSEI